LANFHVPDYLILPFGRATKDDLRRIALSAVSADGLYFSSEVSCVFIRKSDQKPLCLGRFDEVFGDIQDPDRQLKDDIQLLRFMRGAIKSNNPQMTNFEELFVDLYFSILEASHLRALGDPAGREQLSDLGVNPKYFGVMGAPLGHIWRALVPIPELQLYVRDPLSPERSYHPENNFRVDYGFWNGDRIIAVEIDGAEPAGYARDIRRDRLLRQAGVDVIHILNLELQRHRGRALAELLSPRFFGFGWNYEGRRPFTWPF
jgi:hypothetical protein